MSVARGSHVPAGTVRRGQDAVEPAARHTVGGPGAVGRCDVKKCGSAYPIDPPAIIHEAAVHPGRRYLAPGDDVAVDGDHSVRSGAAVDLEYVPNARSPTGDGDGVLAV